MSTSGIAVLTTAILTTQYDRLSQQQLRFLFAFVYTSSLSSRPTCL